MTATLNRPRESAEKRATAAPEEPELPLLPLLPLLPEDELPVEAGADGIDVPVALARQELAAAFAAEMDGELLFTVPLPEKLQA